MRTFIEVAAKGGRRAIVDTSLIAGVLTPTQGDRHRLGTTENPVTLLLRNTPPVDLVGIDTVMVLARMTEAMAKAEHVRDRDGDEAPPVAIQWLDGSGSDAADG